MQKQHTKKEGIFNLSTVIAILVIYNRERNLKNLVTSFAIKLPKQ